MTPDETSETERWTVPVTIDLVYDVESTATELGPVRLVCAEVPPRDDAVGAPLDENGLRPVEDEPVTGALPVRALADAHLLARCYSPPAAAAAHGYSIETVMASNDRMADEGYELVLYAVLAELEEQPGSQTTVMAFTSYAEAADYIDTVLLADEATP